MEHNRSSGVAHDVSLFAQSAVRERPSDASSPDGQILATSSGTAALQFAAASLSHETRDISLPVVLPSLSPAGSPLIEGRPGPVSAVNIANGGAALSGAMDFSWPEGQSESRGVAAGSPAVDAAGAAAANVRSDVPATGAAWHPPPLRLPSESDLQHGCYDFLQWLCQPAETASELLVKARRITSLKQLHPIKLHLRSLFALLYECDAVQEVNLALLAQLPVCRVLHDAVRQRRVGGARVHALFLVIKKVLVFLASQESKRLRQLVLPSASESFVFVDCICAESSHRRHQEARNRSVLGRTAASLQGVSDFGGMGPSGFVEVPLTWSPVQPTQQGISPYSHSQRRRSRGSAGRAHEPPPTSQLP
jgi:hypothetical protein